MQMQTCIKWNRGAWQKYVQGFLCFALSLLLMLMPAMQSLAAPGERLAESGLSVPMLAAASGHRDILASGSGTAAVASSGSQDAPAENLSESAAEADFSQELSTQLELVGRLHRGETPTALGAVYIPTVIYMKRPDSPAAELLSEPGQRTAFVQKAEKQQRALIARIEKVLGRRILVERPTYLVSNAFMTACTAEEWRRLEALSGEIALEISYPVIARPTEQGKRRRRRDLDFALAQARGQGQLIAIIDSGFDVTHPDFRLSEDTRAQLDSEAQVSALVEENGLPGKWYTRKVPYGYNYADQNFDLLEEGESHGMHVAGIALANGQMQGQAPEAQLLAMRVFGAGEGGTAPYLYNEALDHALRLGARSINMSLGTSFAMLEDVSPQTAMALDRARLAGAIVSISAGNSGYVNIDISAPKTETPSYGSVAAPSLLAKSLSVASLNAESITAPILEAFELTASSANESSSAGAANAADMPSSAGAADVSGTRRAPEPEAVMAFPYQAASVQALDEMTAQERFYELIDLGLGRTSDMEGKDVSGKVALIERGEITFVEKVQNAAQAGAVAALIFNSEQGGENFASMNLEHESLPVFALYHSHGMRLREALALGADDEVVTSTSAADREAGTGSDVGTEGRAAPDAGMGAGMAAENAVPADTGKAVLATGSEAARAGKSHQAETVGGAGRTAVAESASRTESLREAGQGELRLATDSQARALAAVTSSETARPVNSIRFTKRLGNFPYDGAGLMSSFSSWGPTPEFDLKPEITAVGGNVYATLPHGRYGLLSGTSMASPQIAGIAALLQQRLSADPVFANMGEDARAIFVKNLLMSTAVPQRRGGVFISPRQQGAGLVDKAAALQTWAYVSAATPPPGPNLVNPAVFSEYEDNGLEETESSEESREKKITVNSTESASEGRTEPGTERGAESASEGRTESGTERGAESASEGRTEPGTEPDAESGADHGTEGDTENGEASRSVDSAPAGGTQPSLPDMGTDTALLSKVNLGAVQDGQFSFEVILYNFSEEKTLSFRPEASLITDLPDDEREQFLRPGQSQLIGEPWSGETITLAPGTQRKLAISFDFSAEADALMEIFTNGFFVEGFVRFISETESQPDIGLPFIGFWGREDAQGRRKSYGAQPVLEKPIYEFGDGGDIHDPSGNLPMYYMMKDSVEANPFTALMSEIYGHKVVLGELSATPDKYEENNPLFEPEHDHGQASDGEIGEFVPRHFSSDAIYLSPNGDGVYETLYFQGNFVNDYVRAGFHVESESGEEVFRSEDRFVSEYSYGRKNWFDTVMSKGRRGDSRVSTLPDWRWSGHRKSTVVLQEGEALPDGLYYYVFHAQGIAKDAEPQILRFPVLLDVTAPELADGRTGEVPGGAAAGASETAWFSGRLVEEGSGLLSASLQRGSRGGASAERPDTAPEESGEMLTPDEEGYLNFAYDPAHAEDYFVTLMDRAGNRFVRSLPVLLLRDAWGSPTVRFFATEDDHSGPKDEDGNEIPQEVEPGRVNYDVHIYSEAGVLQKDKEHLPYGKYYAQITMAATEFSVLDERIDFEITQEERFPELSVRLLRHVTSELLVNLDFKPNLEAFGSGEIRLQARNMETGEIFPMEVHYFHGYFAAASVGLTEGRWVVEAAGLQEGWHIYPGSTELEVKRGVDAKSFLIRVFKDAGSIVPQTHIHGEQADLEENDIVYEAYGDIFMRRGLINIPAGGYTVFPREVPKGYYAAPGFVELSLKAGETQSPEFHFYPLGADSYGSVHITESGTAKERGLPDAVETRYVASDLYGNRHTDLSRLPFGTWYIEPSYYDPRFKMEPAQAMVVIDEQHRELNLHFTWTSLSEEGKTANVVVTAEWEDDVYAAEVFENGGYDTYWYDLTNMETGESLRLKGEGTLQYKFLHKVPYGFYIIRPVLAGIEAIADPQNYRVWPEFQAVRVTDSSSGEIQVPEPFYYGRYGEAVRFTEAETEENTPRGAVDTVSEYELLLRSAAHSDSPQQGLTEAPFLKLPLYEYAKIAYRGELPSGSLISSEEEEEAQAAAIEALEQAARAADYGLSLSARRLTDNPALQSLRPEGLALPEHAVQVNSVGWELVLQQTDKEGKVREIHHFDEDFHSKIPAILYIPLPEKVGEAAASGRLQLYYVERETDSESAIRHMSLQKLTRLLTEQTVDGVRQTYLALPVNHLSEYRLVYWEEKPAEGRPDIEKPDTERPDIKRPHAGADDSTGAAAEMPDGAAGAAVSDGGGRANSFAPGGGLSGAAGADYTVLPKREDGTLEQAGTSQKEQSKHAARAGDKNSGGSAQNGARAAQDEMKYGKNSAKHRQDAETHRQSREKQNHNDKAAEAGRNGAAQAQNVEVAEAGQGSEESRADREESGSGRRSLTEAVLAYGLLPYAWILLCVGGLAIIVGFALRRRRKRR